MEVTQVPGSSRDYICTAKGYTVVAILPIILFSNHINVLQFAVRSVERTVVVLLTASPRRRPQIFQYVHESLYTDLNHRQSNTVTYLHPQQ